MKESKSDLRVFLSMAICLLGISATSPVATAGEKPQEDTIMLKTKNHNTGRPKAPSLQRITCVYDGEFLHFDFVLPEGECILTLTGGSNISCTFDSTDLNAEVYVGPIEYTTELTLTTEYGNQYSGTLEM